MYVIENLVFWFEIQTVFFCNYLKLPISITEFLQCHLELCVSGIRCVGHSPNYRWIEWVGIKWEGHNPNYRWVGGQIMWWGWYEWVRLYCGWVRRKVLVKLMWLYLRVGHDKLECGLCWVGFGWSLEESESKSSVSAITNHIKIKSPSLYIWQNISLNSNILIFYDLVLLVILLLT